MHVVVRYVMSCMKKNSLQQSMLYLSCVVTGLLVFTAIAVLPSCLCLPLSHQKSTTVFCMCFTVRNTSLFSCFVLCSCNPGYLGPTCSNVCAKNKYGLNCASTCTCQNDAICSPLDGTCTCLAGWAGSKPPPCMLQVFV